MVTYLKSPVLSMCERRVNILTIKCHACFRRYNQEYTSCRPSRTPVKLGNRPVSSLRYVKYLDDNLVTRQQNYFRSSHADKSLVRSPNSRGMPNSLQAEPVHESLTTGVAQPAPFGATARSSENIKAVAEDIVPSPDKLAQALEQVSLSGQQPHTLSGQERPRRKKSSRIAPNLSEATGDRTAKITPRNAPEYLTRSRTHQQRKLHTQDEQRITPNQHREHRKNTVNSLTTAIQQVSLSPNQDAGERKSQTADAKTRVPRGVTKPTAQVADEHVPPLPVPEPSETYLQHSKVAPTRRDQAQPLLIIVDLNGTLIYRRKGRGLSHVFTPRPGLPEFLEFLFSSSDPNLYTVMVWSSARPENVKKILAKMLEPWQRDRVCAVLARDKFGLTQKQYNAKIQVYKQLESVWASAAVQRAYPKSFKLPTSGNESFKMQWNQHNTLILEDSALKCIANPHNVVLVPELVRETLAHEQSHNVLRQVASYVRECAHWSDVSAYTRQSPFVVGTG